MSFTHDIEITPGDIRRAWGSIMEGENPFSDRQSSSNLVKVNLAAYRSSELTPWIGATGAEINDRLLHGYPDQTADLKIDGGQTEFTVPTMLLDEEEGDLLIDQVLGGEDAYRVMWSEQDAPKSLTIRACIGMAAGTGSEVLAEYMTWLLKVIDTAVANGYAPTVELWIGTRGAFQRFGRETMRVTIPLVNAGEMMDVDSWRAYLTPGAFRSLGFVAIGLAADRTKGIRRLTPGLGSPTNRSWGITHEDGVLEIECPLTSDHFPEQHMNELLEAVI